MKKNYKLPSLHVSVKSLNLTLLQSCALTVFFFLLLFSPPPCAAQQEAEYLDVNNVKAYIDPFRMFYNNNAAFEAPKNSGKSTIFTSNIWLGGLDGEGNVRVAAHKYCENGNRDFWFGPLPEDSCRFYSFVCAPWGEYWYDTVLCDKKVGDALIFTEEYKQKYNHVWKVSREEIEYHKAHYKEQTYKMPWGIANWPAHGRVEFGESKNLAPFVDVNGNGKYDPLYGDYPKIPGDQAVFFIMNDLGGKHTESGSLYSMGIEVFCMAYAFNTPNPILNNTIFLSYEVKNRGAEALTWNEHCYEYVGTTNFHNFYFGLWNDFDIGFKDDDYIGCDTLLNLSYAYNGLEKDGNGQPWAYGENPPVQGAIFLNQTMSACISQNNSFYPQGPPNFTTEYYNLLRGKWKTGEYVYYGGNGYNPNPNGSETITTYMFSGDPVTKTGWTELTPDGEGSTPHTPGDRLGLMSTGPFNLPIGGSLKVDIALPFVRTEGKNRLSALALLREYTEEIQEYYNEFLSIKEKPTRTVSKLLTYPNPTTGQLTIYNGQLTINNVEIFDMMGKKQLSIINCPLSIEIDISNLPTGVYFVKATHQNNTVGTAKIIKH